MDENRRDCKVVPIDLLGDGSKEILMYANFEYQGTASHPLKLKIYKVVDGELREIWFEQLLFEQIETGTQYDSTLKFDADGNIEFEFVDNKWKRIDKTSDSPFYLHSSRRVWRFYEWTGREYTLADKEVLVEETLEGVE